MMSFEPFLPMKHYSDFDSPAGALGHLQAGRHVRSDVEPEDDGVPWMGRPIFLHGGDVYCDNCRELIDPQEQFTNAWVNVLARQKKDHGGTWCQDCFTDGAHLEDEQDSDTDDSHTRQFK